MVGLVGVFRQLGDLAERENYFKIWLHLCRTLLVLSLHSCRTMRTLWNTRVSPNVIYSMHHLRSDKSTLVVGGIDGVLRFLEQDSGEAFSRCIMNESSSSISNSSRDSYGVVQVKKARRLLEDTRIDLIPRTSQPPVRCLAVGMQKLSAMEKLVRFEKLSSWAEHSFLFKIANEED